MVSAVYQHVSSLSMQSFAIASSQLVLQTSTRNLKQATRHLTHPPANYDTPRSIARSNKKARSKRRKRKIPGSPNTASISINQRARRTTGSGQIALTPRAGVLTASSKNKRGEKICPPSCHNAPQLRGAVPRIPDRVHKEKGRSAMSKARNARGGQTMTHRQQHHRQPP